MGSVIDETSVHLPRIDHFHRLLAVFATSCFVPDFESVQIQKRILFQRSHINDFEACYVSLRHTNTQGILQKTCAPQNADQKGNQ